MTKLTRPDNKQPAEYVAFLRGYVCLIRPDNGQPAEYIATTRG